MPETYSQSKGYAMAAIIGAMGGGLLVALVTRAIPKMMSQIGITSCDPMEM